MRLTPQQVLAGLAAAVLLGAPEAAHAYMGPGLGLGALGVAFGVIGSLLLGLFSILWYPFKRLWRAVRRKASRPESDTPSDTEA